MTELESIFNGLDNTDKVDRICALTSRMQQIESAIGCIKYNEELLLEIPEVLKTLSAGKDEVIAKLKTI
jgi:hypothetical protein